MGDERPTSAEPATSSTAQAGATAAAAGRDQVPVRTTPSAAEIGGGSVERSEIAEGQQSPHDVLRLGVGPTSRSAETRSDSEASDSKGGPRCDKEAYEADEVFEGQMTLDEIEVHVVRAIRYHEARARFLDFWRRVFDFLVILGGAGSVTAAANTYPAVATVLGVTLAAIGAIQLVAGFSEKAGEHASLKRRFCAVLARISEARTDPAAGPHTVAKIAKRWSAIWADEPPTMHVLESIAYNAALRTLRPDLADDDLIYIGPWESLTRNLSSWESFEPRTRGERVAQERGNNDRLLTRLRKVFVP